MIAAYCEGRKIATVYRGKRGRWFIAWESGRADEWVSSQQGGKEWVEKLWHHRAIEWKKGDM